MNLKLIVLVSCLFSANIASAKNSITDHGHYQFEINRERGMTARFVVDPETCLKFGKGELSTLTIQEDYEVMPSIPKSKLTTSISDSDYDKSIPYNACKRALGVGVSITEAIKEIPKIDQNEVVISTDEPIKMETYSKYTYDEKDEDNYLDFEGVTSVMVKKAHRQLSLPVNACLNPNWNGALKLTDLNGYNAVNYNKGSVTYNGLLARGCLNLVEGFKLYAERSKNPSKYPGVKEVNKIMKLFD